MKIKQLGNSTGLDVSSVSPSFLINYDTDRYLLFDCGYNVLPQVISAIKEDSCDEKLAWSNLLVYISHVHEDHIANLQALIHYVRFIVGLKDQKITILTHIDAYNTLYKYLDITEYKVDDPVWQPIHDFAVLTDYNSLDIHVDYSVTLSPAKHILDTFSRGIILFKKDKSEAILITGDTVADKRIEENFYYLGLKNSDYLVFHDCNNFEQIPQPHSKCSELQQVYSEEFLRHMIMYHNGKDFSKEWYIIGGK